MTTRQDLPQDVLHGLHGLDQSSAEGNAGSQGALPQANAQDAHCADLSAAPASETAIPGRRMAGVVHVAHRFPMRNMPHRDPSAYLLSPARLLARNTEDFRPACRRIEQWLTPPAVLLMASARHGDGRSIVALQLGIAFAQEFARVAYVEADFRRPALHTFFDLPASKGVADLLREPDSMGDASACMLPTDIAGLYLLPAGACSGIPDLLESPQLPALAQWLRAGADWAMIDCPPLLTYADAWPLLGLVDGVVVIAHEGRTRDEDLVELSARLARVSAPVVETVYVKD